MGLLSIDAEWVVYTLYNVYYAQKVHVYIKYSICIHKIVMSKKANIEISSWLFYPFMIIS